MKTRSLRLRVIVGVLMALTAVLFAGGVVVERTLSSQLRGDLRQRLVDRVGYGELLAENGYSGNDLADALSTNDGVTVRITDADGNTVTGVPQPAGPGAPGGGPPRPAGHAPKAVQNAVDVSADSRGITAKVEVTGGTITATGSTFEISQTLQRLRTIELLAGLATLVVVAMLLTGIVSVALRPLSRMTGLARGIARGGRGGRLRPDNPRTELGRTAEAFDEMLNALETAERDAQHAAATATAAEERMRRLLADVSHELRTPVAALQARAETLLRDNPARGRREELAVGIVRDTRRAARLVDDLLLMNRLEQFPTGQVRLRPVELGALVRGVVDEQQEAQTGVGLVARTGVPVWVSGDPDRLTQVVANLIGNARRAVGRSGDVVVEVRAEARTAVVEVSDSGPGVPVADRERVFDRFVRLDAGRSRSDGGSGLGLPISRAIARAHGGDVVCTESERGATFVVTVPLGVRAEIAPEPATEEPALV